MESKVEKTGSHDKVLKKSRRKGDVKKGMMLHLLMKMLLYSENKL